MLCARFAWRQDALFQKSESGTGSIAVHHNTLAYDVAGELAAQHGHHRTYFSRVTEALGGNIPGCDKTADFFLIGDAVFPGARVELVAYKRSVVHAGQNVVERDIVLRHP